MRQRLGALLLAALALAVRTGDLQAQELPDPTAFAGQVLAYGAGSTEAGHDLQARPEVFLQVRLSRWPLDRIDESADDENFQLTRLETRWSGRLSSRVGAGVEFQWHPALHGATDELVNDAFVEFYVTKVLTVRTGQFVKPFGFDIMQSSADREYPERAMFAGYFFPGQRDRGVLVRWERERPAARLGSTQAYAALLNGNRFWADNDGHLDTVLRIRQQLAHGRLALGASAQVGSQIVRPDQNASTRVRLAGLDAQVAVGSVGVRGEWVHGTRPSTLLSRTPEFTAAFADGATTTGLAASLILRLHQAGHAYIRLDRITGDPMTGGRARAVDAGYRHALGGQAHLAVDYQWKTGVTRNDDAVNTRFQATLGVVF